MLLYARIIALFNRFVKKWNRAYGSLFRGCVTS